MNAAAPAPIGAVAHYNLLERLEPAGPGELFRARDTRLGRTVTIRLLPADFATGPERERFLQEARKVIPLSHPNVITLFDLGEHEGRLYVAFEHVTGQPLRAVAAGRPLKVRRAVELAVQIADAVAAAHAGGIVHGGLSPETIVVTAKGHAKIPAHELASPGGFAPTGGEVRLRDYDAPEEAQGRPVDERSDVYSTGAVLYELLTVRRPLHRGSAAPSAANPGVPPELDAVVLHAVAPNPERRVGSAAALAAELRGVLSSIDEREAAAAPQRPESSTSIGRVLALSAAILAALAAILVYLLR